MWFYCERSLHTKETGNVSELYSFGLMWHHWVHAGECYDAITPLHCQWINKHWVYCPVWPVKLVFAPSPSEVTMGADAEDGRVQSRTHLQAVNGTSARVWEWEFLKGWERETGMEGWMDQRWSTFNEALIQRAQGLRRGWKVTFRDNDPWHYCPTTISIFRGQKIPK